MSTWERRQTREGDRYLVCTPLEREGLRHAFTLRPSGSSPREPSSRALPGEVLRDIGLPPSPVATLVQVHGSTVSLAAGGSAVPREADAVVISSGTAAIATADCVGAILHEPRSRATAVVHAGWRGTITGVLGAAIARLGSHSGEPPSSFLLAMGPAIGGCCYEVGEDVATPFAALFGAPQEAARIFGSRAGKTTIDLAAANAALALRSGLAPERIHVAGICTSCRRDLCWSYRAEGKGAGRMWAIAGRSAGDCAAGFSFSRNPCRTSS